MIKRFLILTFVVLGLVSCKSDDVVNQNNISIDDMESKIVTAEVEPINETGKIFLYGEIHGQERILEKEFDLWKQYYHEDNMRHLFIESPYSKAQLLNLWMQDDHDGILIDVMGSNGDLEAVLNFYRNIKSECPETIFHGTDVNGYKSTYPGIEYRKYLEENDLKDSPMYQLNEESIEQVKYYSQSGDDIYREAKLVENFIRELNSIGNHDIMGIYGAAHIANDEFTKDSNTVTSMAYQLSLVYGDRLIRIDLTDELLKGLLDEPLSIGEFELGGKLYTAEYYGINETTNSPLILSFEYWKLIDAYEDYKDAEQIGEFIPAYNYPMKLKENNIYVIEALLKDNTKMIYQTIVDGSLVDGILTSKQFKIE